MNNPELRCASTMLAVEDFRDGLEAESDRIASLVACNQRDNTVRVLRYAADGLIFGRFPDATAALEFVFDSIL